MQTLDRLLTFFIAIFWECVYGTSTVTQITASIVAGTSVLLLVAIISNSDWESLPRISSLASKMEQMETLVLRARESVVMRWCSFSRSISLTTSMMGRRLAVQISGPDRGQRTSGVRRTLSSGLDREEMAAE